MQDTLQGPNRLQKTLRTCLPAQAMTLYLWTSAHQNLVSSVLPSTCIILSRACTLCYMSPLNCVECKTNMKFTGNSSSACLCVQTTITENEYAIAQDLYREKGRGQIMRAASRQLVNFPKVLQEIRWGQTQQAAPHHNTVSCSPLALHASI